LFKMRVSGFFGLYNHHQTDGFSLSFASM